MRLTFKSGTIPHLHISATIRESKKLRTYPANMGYSPPAWCIPVKALADHIKLILASPVALTDTELDNLNREAKACHEATKRGIHVALFLASDMEKEGWNRFAVTAHEHVHLQLAHAAHDSVKYGRLKAVMSCVAVALAPHMRSYLMQFPPPLATEEFLADLISAQEYMKSMKTSAQKAVKYMGRGEKDLTAAIKVGLNGSTLLTTILAAL